MNRLEGLPWHVRVEDHVYIWAGGELVRRMHHSLYAALVHGLPVSAEILAAEEWTDRESFEKACAEHEREHRPPMLLPPLLHGR